MQRNDKDTEIKKLRPAIYLRVSTEDQGNKYGLKIQEDAVRNFINNRHDYLSSEHAEVYIDEISGTLKIQNRPALKQLFDDIKYAPDGEPPFDIVVVYKIDRFARDLRVLLEIIEELKENNVSFASTQEMIDTSTPFGKAMLGILGVFAELDRDMIVQKTQEGIGKSLLQGTWYKEIFGYKKDKNKRPYIYEEQAEIVRRIFYMFVDLQYPISKICAILTDEKIPIPSAWDQDNFVSKSLVNVYRWRDRTIRDMLSDDVYIGIYHYDRQSYTKDKITGKKIIKYLSKEEWKTSPIGHDPIIDNLTFSKAGLLLDKKKGNFKSSSEYILGGLIKCNHCKDDKINGMVSWSGTASNGSKYYQCSGKNTQKYPIHPCCTIPIPKNELESIVKEQMKEIILNPKIIEKHIDKTRGHLGTQKFILKNISKINLQIENLVKKLGELEELFANPNTDISGSGYMILTNKVSAQLNAKYQERKDLEIKLSKSVEHEKQIKAMNYVQEVYKNLDEIFSNDEKCKELFNILVENIIIHSETDESISVTGRKKKSGVQQAFPKGMIINFKLPQDFLNDIFLNEGVKDEIKELR